MIKELLVISLSVTAVAIIIVLLSYGCNQDVDRMRIRVREFEACQIKCHPQGSEWLVESKVCLCKGKAR